jgi:hypothetical protein
MCRSATYGRRGSQSSSGDDATSRREAERGEVGGGAATQSEAGAAKQHEGYEYSGRLGARARDVL